MPRNWHEVIMDGNIPNETQYTAPNGERVSMGQIREAFWQREGEIRRRESDIKNAQAELANVYQLLQGEKVAVEAAKEAMLTREAEMADLRKDTAREDGSGRDDKGRFTKDAAILARVEAAEKRLADIHRNEVEMADIYLNDVWSRTIGDYKDVVPDGINRNDVLKFAMQQGIRDERGIPDIRRALDRIAEPRVRERELRDAEERGARRREEEIVLKQMGSPRAFQNRGEEGASQKQTYASLDEAFEAAAKDASIFYSPTQVQ